MRPSLIACTLMIVPLLLTGCQQRMAEQPSYRPLAPSTFYPDGRSAREPVPGTVARGHLRTDNALFRGRRSTPGSGNARVAALMGLQWWQPVIGALGVAADQDFVTEFPFPVTPEFVKHGQDRYMIYCVVCHDPLGTGRGKIVERGYTPPPSYHIERLRQVPIGHIYAVIGEGYGSMPSYAEQIPPRDRWAIASYIRALQLSQHYPESDLTPAMRDDLTKAATAGGPRP